MNTARWLPLPVLEREIAGQERAVVNAGRRLRLWVLLGLLSIPALPALATSSAGILLLALIPAYLLLLLWLVLWMIWAHEKAQNSARERDRATLEELSDRPGWLVDLLVLQGEAPTGADRGILWIEDGRLYFAGRRTSFGITADQVHDFCRLSDAIPGIRNDLILRMNHRTSVGMLGISFTLVGPSRPSDRRPTLEVLETVNRWIGRGQAIEGQIPPVTLGLGAPSSAQLALGAAGSIGFWTVIVLGFPTLLYFLGSIVAVIFGLFGLLVGATWAPVWAPRLRLQAWLHRRRL